MVWTSVLIESLFSAFLGGWKDERAMNYFDMRNVPPGVRKQGSELARELKIIADRSLRVDINTIRDDPSCQVFCLCHLIDKPVPSPYFVRPA